jgi:hypothetical protein
MLEFANTAKLIRGISLLSVFIFVLSCGSAIAQSSKATVSGTVTDANGAVVPEAKVIVRNAATGETRETTTNAEGFYEVPLLDIGTYTVTVSKTGFQTVRRENITLQTATETSADVQLPTGEISNEVVITAEAPLVQTETGERSAIITGREVTELPLSGQNFTQLATLTPGVARVNNVGVGGGPEARAFNNGDPRAGSGGPGSSNENGSTESSRFARSGGANLSVNGQRATQNNFSLDGVDNNEPQFGTIGVYPNPESIAEFKVSTSIPPAEVGRAAGAVITVTTKSGGNQFSGSAFYTGQSSKLNAYHPVLKTKLAEEIARGTRPGTVQYDALLKPVQQINNFGGTFGGPIIKNRTFFFADYWGQRNRLPFPANTTVPTVGAKTGDFSGYLVRNAQGQIIAGQIFNPYTGQPFANNIIPSNLINSVGQKYLQAFPNPTTNVINPSGRLDCCINSNSGGPNYFTQRANEENINNFKIRIDHKFNDRNSINGSFNEQKQDTVRANLFPGNIPTAGFGAGEERTNARYFNVSDVHTFSPTVLNEFRFGITQIQISIFNCGVGGACGVSPTFAQDIGIPNSNDGTDLASGGALIGNFGNGFTEFTGDGGLFQVKSKNPYFADTVTVIRGNHTIKFGGELRLRYLNTVDGGRTGALKGQFQYGDRGPASKPLVAGQVCPAQSTTVVNGVTQCFVRPDGIPYGGTGSSLANILLNTVPDLVTKGQIFGGPFDLRSQEWGFFVQDDWKASDRLTLNLGLRYDLFTPNSEANGRYSLYDPAQRQVVVASGGDDRIVSTDKNNFGPRASFAYAINSDKTLVLRGGYGLIYSLDGVDYPPGIRNAPFSNSVSRDQFDVPSTGSVFTLASGPPPVPQSINPANIPQDFAVYAIDQEQITPYTHQFQLSMQYQFWKEYSIDIGYVGNRTRNLLYANNIGSGGAGIARNAAGQLLNSAIIYTNGAKSQYDSLQVQFQKRYSRNIQGQVSYTFSRTLDNSTGIFNGLGDQREGRNGPINPLNLDDDWGRSSLDVPHLLSASAIIDLPFGKGQPFLDRGGIVDKLVGGWQLNFLVNGRSGYRFSVVANGGIQRPSLVGDPFANLTSGRLLNRAAFSETANLRSVTNAAGQVIRFGNLERNAFQGPSIWTTDMSVFKNIAITERVRFQLGFEFYNLFNRLNFTVPNNNVSNGDFGEIKNNAQSGRTVQYRAKINF